MIKSFHIIDNTLNFLTLYMYIEYVTVHFIVKTYNNSNHT